VRHAKVSYKKYRKLSVCALTTGMLAVSFCILYFLLWILADGLLERLVADYGCISYMLLSFVSTGIGLTVASVVTGSVDLKRIKTGISSRKGNGLDITGIILGSVLILFGFILWFVDFFGFMNIIS
jgi:hypothetical protein